MFSLFDVHNITYKKQGEIVRKIFNFTIMIYLYLIYLSIIYWVDEYINNFNICFVVKQHELEIPDISTEFIEEYDEGLFCSVLIDFNIMFTLHTKHTEDNPNF